MRKGMKVFISYQERIADSMAAKRLYKFLKAKGWSPWLDKFSIAPGSNWQQEINTAIANCDVFLVSIPPEYSSHIADEIKKARSYNKPILPFVWQVSFLYGNAQSRLKRLSAYNISEIQAFIASQWSPFRNVHRELRKFLKI